MTTLTRSSLLSSCLLVSVVFNSAHAVELLTNGGLEPVGGEFPGWSLIETDENGATVNSGEPRPFADRDGDGLGIWLRPWVGGNEAPSPLANTVFSQTVPATAGEGYSFEGWARWETNYAGGVETLDASSPLGDIPSPTRTEMELAFLDTGGNVIGTPHTLDLRTTEQSNDGLFFQHRFDDVFGDGSPLAAPDGTANVRVSASMIDGAFNVDPAQSAFFDDFSLIAASSELELLENGLLDAAVPDFFGWEVIEFPEGTDTVSPAGFAQNPNSSGEMGAFLRPWANGGDSNDAIFSQTVAGVAGGEYTASLWSRFEPNFAGGVDTLDEASPNGEEDSLTETTLELAFLDGSGTEIGSPVVLDLKADRIEQGDNANDNLWYQHTIQATAPAETEMVKITGAMIEGVLNIDPAQSAFFDDFSLDGPGGSSSGSLDFNNDGLVDASDAPLLCAAIGNADVSQTLLDAGYSNGDFDLNGTVEFADFLTLSANFGSDGHFGQGNADCTNGIEFADFLVLSSNFGKTGSGVQAVPEPAAGFLMVIAMIFGAAVRTRRPSCRRR